MVETFELLEAGARAFGTYESLAAASAALPQGSYTTLRTYHGNRLLRLAQHARRLEESLASAAPLDERLLRGGLAALLPAATRETESRLRLTYAPPRLFVSRESFDPLPARLYEDGVACVTVLVRRDNPHAKDTRFIATAARTYAALPAGATEGLMVAEDGAILEGLSSNFFGVLAGRLRTEEERVLSGVTRALVLEVAAGVAPVERSPVRVRELDRVDECFITSVSREILPVVSIDGRRIGDGRPGPVTRRLIEAFAALVEREAAPPLPSKAFGA